MFRRRRNDLIAYCYGTEPTGEVLVQDIWFFNRSYWSMRRLWKQITEWKAKFAGDENFRWYIGERGNRI